MQHDSSKAAKAVDILLSNLKELLPVIVWTTGWLMIVLAIINYQMENPLSQKAVWSVVIGLALGGTLGAVTVNMLRAMRGYGGSLSDQIRGRKSVTVGDGPIWLGQTNHRERL